MDKKVKNKPNKRVVMVRVDADTYKRLRVLAASMGKENAEVITEAIALLDAQEGGPS